MTPTAFAMLRLSLVKGVGPARLRKARRMADARRVELEQLVEAGDLRDVLSRDQLDDLSTNGATAELLVEKLDGIGATAICIADPAYPAELARRYGDDHAPPLLMIRGNAALLQQPSVGFCGSREASDRGLRATDDCAAQLANSDVVVTSGYAAGVDLRAHRAALVAGGKTTVVLAEGIVGFRIKPELGEAWSWERTCVVSEFAATAPWSAGNAMQRNRTIVGLSRAMIVVEARATGGTIAAGRDALAARVPLFAVEYEGLPDTAIGNRELIELGATPLRRSRTTMRASLDGVMGAVRGESSSSTSAMAGQLRLTT